MLANDMPKLPIASKPLWKVLLVDLPLSSTAAFVATWAVPLMAYGRWDLTAWPFIHSATLTLALTCQWWAWRPPVCVRARTGRQRKHLRWLRWWSYALFNVYLSALFVAGGVVFSNILLAAPWRCIVNGVSIALLILACFLPAISKRAARRLASALDTLGAKMSRIRGRTAVLLAVNSCCSAALVGIYGAPAPGQFHPLHVVLALGFPVSGIFLTQYSAAQSWPHRPWQKDKEA